jgi:hypothetical protein
MKNMYLFSFMSRLELKERCCLTQDLPGDKTQRALHLTRLNGYKNIIRRWIALLLVLSLGACTATLPSGPRPVTLVSDGERRRVETEAETVRELLREADVTLGDLDRVTPAETTGLRSGMVISVTRVTQHTETYTETLPFGRRVVRDATMPEGTTRLLESGHAGELERVYLITEEDGTEVERTLLRETVTRAPQDEVQLVGTRPEVQKIDISGTLTYLHNQDAWVMRDTNRRRRRITTLGDLDGRVFALSPDGTRLIFSRAVTEPEHINALWLVRTAEADPNPVPLNLNDVLWAAWAPDGERIAWTTAEPVARAPGWRGQNDLWTARVSAVNALTARRQILEAEGGGGYGWWGTRYAWSPDGETLAYARPESVGIVDEDARDLLALLTFPAYRTYSSWAWAPTMAWSPDGAFIATTAHGPAPDGSDPEESPVFDLWVLEATGAYSAELASEVGMWATPRFAPDGERLLFGRAIVPYQSETSPHTLCTLDRDGSDPRCLYPPDDSVPGVEVPAWRWTSDGAHIAFIYRGDIYLLAPQDGTAMPLTDEGGITYFDWR